MNLFCRYFELEVLYDLYSRCYDDCAPDIWALIDYWKAALCG